MKIYDFLIIGAGAAGCASAYFLREEGKSVAIVDKEGVAQGASGAAGAFLSPLPGKKNPYNTIINDALHYSLAFYEKAVPHAMEKKGVLRVPNENFTKEKLSESIIECDWLDSQKLKEISIDFTDIDGCFYKDGAIIKPQDVCTELVKGCDFFEIDVEKLKYDGLWYAGDIAAKNIVLAQGVYTPLIETPYMDISPVFGLRIDVKTDTDIPFNIHKSISVSANKYDSTLSIGATQHRHASSEFKCSTTCDKCAFYINRDELDVEYLLDEAQKLINIKNAEVVKIYKGARATIKSYFPVIGKIIDLKKSLEKYPSIKKGTKIPPNLLEYYPNAYIVNALGSRGFVLAPYLADILIKSIIHDIDIPNDISTQKLFYKTARTSDNS